MKFRLGMTLFELLTVLVVLSAMATLAVPQLTRRAESSLADATWRSLAEIRGQITGPYADDFFNELPGPLDPSRAAHPQLAYLYLNPFHYTITQVGDLQWNYDPQAKRGWSGPYLTSLA